MPLGSPQTDKFPIGTAEIRIAPMNLALKQMPAHSIGCLDDVTISITNTSVQKKAGFPQRQVANAITENTVTVTGTVGEYSRRNMQIMAGEAPEVVVVDVAGILATSQTAGAVSVPLGTGQGAAFTVGGLVTIYIDGKPELITVAKIASIATDTLTLEAGTPLLHNYPATVTKVFAANPIGKAVTKTSYFSLQVIQSQFSDGRPIAWNFWKASASNGMELAMNPTDFSTTSIELQCLEPAATEFQSGGALAHLANIIPDYPIYMAAPGA